MAAAQRLPAPPPAREIDEQTGVGEVYMTSLLRSQLRPGLAVLAVVLGVLGGLPLLFAYAPGVTSARVAGVPLPWLLLGVAVYPFLLAAAWWHIRSAERVERDFTEILRGRRR